MRNKTLILMMILIAGCLAVLPHADAAAVPRTQFAQRHPITFDDNTGQHVLTEATYAPGSDPTTVTLGPGSDFQVDSFFDIFTELSVQGTPGETYVVDSFFDIFTELSINGGPPSQLSGANIPTVIQVAERSGQRGTWDTEMISMDLTGNVPDPSGGADIGVVLRQSPTLPSPGQTTLRDIGGGAWSVDSFFDIAYEIIVSPPVGGGASVPRNPPGGTVTLVPGNTHAGQRCDQFFGLITANGVDDGGGTGFDGPDPGGEGDWIQYPNSGSGPPWYNQWFYNDPLSTSRSKEIYWDINLTPDGIPGDWVEIAINWSNENYNDPSSPPDPNQEAFIERLEIFNGPLSALGEHLQGFHLIEDYNPEWVSIDVRLITAEFGSEGVHIVGEICHECTPEPATMAVLAVGGLAVLRRRRRKA